MNNFRLACTAESGGALCFRPAALPSTLARRLASLALCAAFAAGPAVAGFAKPVDLEWDANPEPDIASYQLSYGTSSGTYGRTFEAGKAVTATVSELDEGIVYHFAVAATNAGGLKGPYSDEVIHYSGYLNSVPTGSWKVAGAASPAFDGDATTVWLSGPGATPGIHDLDINLGSTLAVGGFRYLPRQDGSTAGNVASYEFYVSRDGIQWGSPVAKGTFATTSQVREIRFNSVSASHVRLRSLASADGSNESAVAEIELIEGAAPLPENRTPVAGSAAVATTAGKGLDILLSATDPDNDPIQFVIMSNPGNGTLTGKPPALIYTPAAGFVGTDRFSFSASDGSLTSAPAEIAVSVAGTNRAPAAFPLSLFGAKNTTIPVPLSGTDADGDPLTFKPVSQPQHGTLTGIHPNLLYTPDLNFLGIDQFLYTASDGTDVSPPAYATILIFGANTAPVATGFAAITAEDTPLAIKLVATDADADSLTYEIVAQPLHGALTGIAPNLTFIPAADYYGTDTFTYRASDGLLKSAVATVSLTVTPVNDFPVAFAKSVTTAKRSPAVITLSASDADNDALTFAIVAQPAHGTLSGTPPNLTYSPTGNYIGADQFSFRANDGTANSAPAIVSISITESNTAPVATGFAAITAEDTPLTIKLAAADADADPLTYEIVAQPLHGALTGIPPNLTFIPAADYHGPDAFTYRADDGLLKSATATVSLTITPVNDIPVALAKSVTTAKRTPAFITLIATDADNDALTFAIVVQPTHGTLSGTPPNLTYSPTDNHTGADQFTFQASDASADSAPALVSITVTNSNTAPFAIAGSLATQENTAAAVGLSGTDIDGDPLAYSIVRQPSHGTLNGSAPAFVYQPAAGYSGTDSFEFVASDGLESSPPATVSIVVSKPAPFAGAAVLARENWKVRNADPTKSAAAALDGDPATAWQSSPGAASPGEIELDLGEIQPVCGFQYLPAPAGSIGSYQLLTSTDAAQWDAPAAGAFSGSSGEKQVLFTTVQARYVRFRALSAASESRAATIAEFNVISGILTNRRPLALSNVLSATAGTPLNIGISAVDPDGTPPAYRLAVPPAHGTLNGDFPELVYTADAGFAGTDRFTYLANDGAVDSLPGSITISVRPNAELNGTVPPVIDRESTIIRSVRNTALVSKIIATGDTNLTFRKLTGPAWITVTPDGIVQAVPMEPASFVVAVSDGQMATATATVRILLEDAPVVVDPPIVIEPPVVTPKNRAPVFATRIVAPAAATELLAWHGGTLATRATDPDAGDTLVFSKTSGPAWLAISRTGEISGNPAEGSAGASDAIVRATDTAGAFAEATLRITVNPNRLPLPWTLSQLGREAIACFADFRAGVFTIGGVGKLAKTDDGATFAWQKLNGDGEIIVRLAEPAGPAKSARTGVAIRQTLAADSRTAFLGTDGRGKIQWIRRVKTGGKASTSTRAKSSAAWLRLTRAGRIVTAYSSPDGVAWEEIGKTKLKLGKTCYIGLSASSGKSSATAASKFANVRILR